MNADRMNLMAAVSAVVAAPASIFMLTGFREAMLILCACMFTWGLVYISMAKEDA